MNRFLDRNGWDLGKYEPSDLRSLEAYRFHVRTYRSPVPLDVAWKAYAALDPSSAWTTSRTRPGVVWDPASSRLYAPGESAPAFSAGQVYVIDLRILGVLRIPAAFRITRIDEPERLIEFVYLRRNLSNGLQRIRFLELPGTDGTTGTFIRHVTWYRSGRSFRDAALYGPVHAALIDAFHAEVFRRIGQPLAASPE